MKVNNTDLLDKETRVLRLDIFNFLFEHEVKRSHRYQDFVTLLILEPDLRLRAAQSLQTLAALVEKLIRQTDLMARVDNATFAILLPQTDLRMAEIVASRIIDHVGSYVFPEEEDQHLTVSIGGACYPATSISVETSVLFKKAKTALKAAKRRGNSVCLADRPVEGGPSQS